MSDNDNIVEKILGELSIKNPNFLQLEAELEKAKQNLDAASLFVKEAEAALEEAKAQPNLVEVAEEKINGMLNLGFDQQAIVDALKIHFSKFIEKKPSKKEALELDDETKKKVIEFILSLKGKFKTTDVWHEFEGYRRSDIFAVIRFLINQNKVVKRGEKRGVHYYVTPFAPKVGN